jgi:ADP-ribose pyrophosphatase YjhB (NUDIX family)
MHRLGATALIIQDGQVLLTRRRDLPLWVAPGGHLDQGETIQSCCLREVKEETGLDVAIDRLVGLYEIPHITRGSKRMMTFVFACRVVGGTPHVTDETTAIRLWPLGKLPKNVPNWHRQYLTDALAAHPSALWRSRPAPLWARLLLRPVLYWRRWQQRLQGKARFTAVGWELGAFVTLFDGDGRVLLVRRRDFPVWNLPGGGVEPDEMPWDAAIREMREETGLEIQLQRLTGVYSKPSQRAVVLNFEGRVVGGRLTPTEEGAESRYFPVDALPEPTLPKHVERIHDSAARRAEVVFKVQDTPPGLELLGFVR